MEEQKNTVNTECGVDEKNFDVNDIYTPLSVAKEEIWRRWNDKELRKKVEDFLGGEFPKIFKEKPKAALFRFIATPNFEFRHFFDFAKISSLDPIYIEFLEDKFCTRNQDKVCLGKITISDGKNKKKIKIIDLQNNDNKNFSNIKTFNGGSLVGFHHDIFAKFYEDVEKFDISSFKTNGENARDVYVKFFSLFLCNGILFENYIKKDNNYEKKFIEDVVSPAFHYVLEKFKIKPLIVPLLPIEDEDQEDWMWYPSQVDDYINENCSK
ncbi:MAG: hypothetical protein ACD_11C00106G0003 [uncultured bacterium]|nr:MAG: hypothetical protein ACD_11C00106G0003 [uncultured bacterium]HBR71378.1 hypothetical protein [Candidatus Moranbacteria bacterium]